MELCIATFISLSSDSHHDETVDGETKNKKLAYTGFQFQTWRLDISGIPNTVSGTVLLKKLTTLITSVDDQFSCQMQFHILNLSIIPVRPKSKKNVNPVEFTVLQIE